MNRQLAEARERLEFFKTECQRKDQEYQALMDEQLKGFNELTQLRGELKDRDDAIANLTTELDKVKAESQKLEGWLAEAAQNEKFYAEELERFKYGVALADPNPDAPGEGEGRSHPPAVNSEPSTVNPPVSNLDSSFETEDREQETGDKEPTTPGESEERSQQPTQKTKQSTANSKPKTTKALQIEAPLLDSVDGTVAASGLMDHIDGMKDKNPKYPDPPRKTQAFTDAARGHTKNLKELEEKYGFKLVGYIFKGKKKEYRYKLKA